MIKAIRNIGIFLIVYVISHGVSHASSGYIKGTLILDNSWEPAIYISLIETFGKEYAVSDNMIITCAPVDSTGRFNLSLDNLTDEWCLLRLHVIKKNDPPASLSIGGMDENFCFIIANRYSEIEIYNTTARPVFSNLSISGAPYMNTFEYITNLADYPNSLDYADLMIEKEFVEEVVCGKLKIIADTCQNPLVSLYSLYQTDFYSDYETDPAFYRDYLSKWRSNNSTFFREFRRELPETHKAVWPYLTIILFAGIIVTATMYIRNRKRRKIHSLSIQERRVFELLQQGASNQEISDKYNIELSTVKSHVSSIFSKLNIKSRKEALDIRLK